MNILPLVTIMVAFADARLARSEAQKITIVHPKKLPATEKAVALTQAFNAFQGMDEYDRTQLGYRASNYYDPSQKEYVENNPIHIMRGKNLIGVAHTDPNDCYISRFFVIASDRGSGAAHALMQATFMSLPNCQEISLISNNSHTTRFYKKEGFIKDSCYMKASNLYYKQPYLEDNTKTNVTDIS